MKKLVKSHASKLNSTAPDFTVIRIPKFCIFILPIVNNCLYMNNMISLSIFQIFCDFISFHSLKKVNQWRNSSKQTNTKFAELPICTLGSFASAIWFCLSYLIYPKFICQNMANFCRLGIIKISFESGLDKNIPNFCLVLLQAPKCFGPVQMF